MNLLKTPIAAACILSWALALPASPCIAQTHAADPRNLQVVASGAVTANRNQRVALVIGNASYKEAPLLNPVNDARAIAKALQDSGFTVILRENTDQRGMMSALREFGDRLRAGGVGVFYYAGHGMQIKGRNYLIPVGANVEREDEVAYSAVDAQAVLDKMEAAGNASNIMILDACRNNPFTRSTRSGQAGLAQMDAPVGTLVAFATSPGAVASDGAGTNGLYTHHLLDAMRKPGLKVEDVFKQVRANVRRDSQGKQVPWEATSLEGDFYFRQGAVGGEQSTAARPVATEAQIEVALWDAVKNSALPIELRAYLNRYPDGRFAEEARGKIAALSPVRVPTSSTVGTVTPSRPMTAATAQTSALVSVRMPFTVGDSWDITISDLLSGQNSKVTNTVASVDGQGNWVMNNGAFRGNAQGQLQYTKSTLNGVLRERSFSDGFRQIPSQLGLGHSESFSYSYDDRFADGRTARFDGKGSFRVIGQEKSTTPAGSYLAWKFERTVEGKRMDSSSSLRVITTAWFVPEIKSVVAQELVETNLFTNKIVQHEKRVLQAVRLVQDVDRRQVAANSQLAANVPTAISFANSLDDANAQASVQRRTDELLKELSLGTPSIVTSPAAAVARPPAASNNFGFAVGDRWRYQTVDRFKKEVVGNWDRRIEAINADGSMKLNNGQIGWAANGAIQFVGISSSASSRQYSPAWDWKPTSFSVGHSQSFQYEGIWRNADQRSGKETRSGTIKVITQERIKVPAGDFDVIRIEISGYAVGRVTGENNNYNEPFKETIWYSTALRNFVANEFEQRSSNGQIIVAQRHELTSFTVRGADEALAKR